MGPLSNWPGDCFGGSRVAILGIWENIYERAEIHKYVSQKYTNAKFEERQLFDKLSKNMVFPD